MSTTITAPITLTPVAISAPVTMEVFEIQAPITLGGRSAYQSYLATSADDPLLSEAEWSASREVVPPSDPVIGAADITDATALGRSLLTAETASAARTELGAGNTGSALFQAATPAAANAVMGIRRFKTTSDVSNSTQTPSSGNVSELTFPVVANSTYRVDFLFILAATGNFPHQIRATYPTARLPDQGDANGFYRYSGKYPTPGATTLDFNDSTAAAATTGIHSGSWFYRPTSSGSVTFQIFNRGADTVTTTLKSGSSITVTEI